MNRLPIFFLLLLGAAGLAPNPPLPPKPMPPNIVLIIVDDMGYEALGCNGGLSYATPAVDALARQGARFENCYALPLCSPSRVQLMTGKYNFRNYERFGYLNPAEKTFAHPLKEAGYATAVAGKWQLGGTPETIHRFGFDEFCLWQLEEGGFWNRYKNPVHHQNGQELTRAGDYGPDAEARFVLDFIDRHRAKPFFVYYPMTLTHDPFQPPPGHPDWTSHAVDKTNDTAYYRAMVGHMDHIVGRITHHLDSLRLRENTVILLTADNGCDQRVLSQTVQGPVKGDKGHTTLAGTHVPLLVSQPGVVPAGLVSPALVDFTDFLPTLLAIAGTRPLSSDVLDGKSFWPAATKKGHPGGRNWLYADYDPKGRDFPPRRYVQDNRFKLYADGSFFDFRQDPLEQRPLNALASSPAIQQGHTHLKRQLAAMESQRRAVLTHQVKK